MSSAQLDGARSMHHETACICCRQKLVREKFVEGLLTVHRCDGCGEVYITRPYVPPGQVEED